MHFLLRIFFCFIYFSLNSLPIHAVSLEKLIIPSFSKEKIPHDLPSQLTKIEKLISELKEIQKNLKDNPQILQQPSLSPLTKGPATFTKKGIYVAIDYLTDFFSNLKEGFLSLSLVFFSVQKALGHSTTIQLYKILFNIFLSGVFGGVAYAVVSYMLNKPFQTLLIQRIPRIPIVQFFLFAIFFFAPFLFFFLFQMIMFFILEHSTSLERIFLSFSMGVILLGITWKFGFYTKNHPHFFATLNLPSSLSSIVISQSLFWIKTSMLSYVVGGWVVDASLFLEIPEQGLFFLLTLSRLGMASSLFCLLQIFKLFVIRKLYNNRFSLLLKKIAHLWPIISNTFVIIGSIVWILEATLFDTILTPILLTLCSFVFTPIIYQGLRRLRIVYLYKNRHNRSTFLWQKLLNLKFVINRLFKWSICIAAIAFILKAWNFNLIKIFQELLGLRLFEQVLDIFTLFVFGYALIQFGEKVLNYYFFEKRYINTDSIEAAQLAAQLKTLINIIRMSMRIAIWVPIFLWALSSLGVDIFPLLTSLGVLTAGITFGSQSLVKDFVTGFFIIFENSLLVGDSVDLDGRTGIVEGLSFRTLRVRMDNGTLLTIPFGSIGIIGNKSRSFACALFNIPVPYDENPERIHKILERAAQNLKKVPSFSKKILGSLEIRGITEITDYSMVFQARFKTIPGQQEIVRRAFNQVLKKSFDDEGVRIPTPSLQERIHTQMTKTS